MGGGVAVGGWGRVGLGGCGWVDGSGWGPRVRWVVGGCPPWRAGSPLVCVYIYIYIYIYIYGQTSFLNYGSCSEIQNGYATPWTLNMGAEFQ